MNMEKTAETIFAVFCVKERSDAGSAYEISR